MNRNLRDAVEAIEAAYATLQGWGGGKGLREVRTSASWLRDPYLSWALPKAERALLRALEVAKVLPPDLDPDVAEKLGYILAEARVAGFAEGGYVEAP